MNTKEFMLAILKNRSFYKRFMISQRQCEIVDFVVASFKCGAVDVANKFNVSIPNASTQLKRLSEIGYLDRKEVVSESGGIEFEYTCRIKDGFVNTISNAKAPSKLMQDPLAPAQIADNERLERIKKL
jgi:hypothetical protein